MRRIFLFTFVGMVSFYNSSFAATSGTCGENCTFEIIDGVLNISGTGEMSSNWHYVNQWPGYYTTPWYGENYEKVIIGKGITSIGANAFAKSNATEIKIPQSVTSIEGGVFSSSKFRNITIPSSVTDFQARFTYMSNLESLTFEGAVPDLSFGRFEGTGQNVTINYTGGSQVRERIQEMMQTASYNWHGVQGYVPKTSVTYQQFNKNSDGSVDYYDSDDHRIKTVFPRGYYITYDPQTGKKLGKYNADGSVYSAKRIYTVKEAIEALGNQGKNTFMLIYR